MAKHLKTANPTTGRPRHIHLSMDKFTEGSNQRQAVLCVLDTDGTPVVVHGTTAVLRPVPDPVPAYTETLPRTPATVRDRHEADGRGVLVHVAECLRKEFGLTDDDITRQVTSSSSDCEGVYSGRVNGFRKIWSEMFNCNHMHLDDRDHRLECLLSKLGETD